MSDPHFVPYRHARINQPQALRQGREFLQELDRRRSIRHFSDDPVPREMIEIAIEAASTAPSGAHRQPWRFVAVDDPELQREIRLAAEHEEYISYEKGRMPEDWIEALRPLGTGWQKPYLEIVPWLVVVFEENYGFDDEGNKQKNYYVRESVGMACGLFVAALHRMGLCTLTHTPSPMGFLSKLLGRPKNEKPYILFPVGYPALDCEVPDIHRKGLDEIAVWNPRGEQEGEAG